MKRRALFLALSMLTAGAWRVVAPQTTPLALSYSYRETAIVFGERPGTIVTIDIDLAPGQTAVIDWAPLPGWQWLPIQEIKAPFNFPTREQYSRFISTGDVVGFYDVRLKP